MADESQIQAAQIKEVRRGILDVLNLAYPSPLTYETICGAFVEIDTHNIKRDLSYLLGKTYVVWCNPRKNAPWEGRKYGLTPAGVEIAQKINTDSALEP